ncbi:MAG: HAD-IC family P-type ATPase [Acidobacteriales bacterium]|nr:HAD-IC family P-type ATPase [Terriglobales bacterium]
MSSWHARPASEILAALEAAASGLTDNEAAHRLERFGPNRLKAAPPASALKILLDQLTGVVVILLIAAAIVSLFLGDHLEAAAIGAVLVINTLIGFITELRARRTMEALLQFDTSRATVMRDGQLRAISAEMLVPGDIIRLDAGHRVPADSRLLETADLRTDEAALTGESLPVSKRSEVIGEDTPLADRKNMAYKGTTVVAGTATAVVTETGAATEIGRIGTLVGTIQQARTPLERRLDALGRRLVWIALAVAVIVAALGAWQGAALGLVIETGIALAVAAVPEALPAVATIALAVGLRRMARRHALVRRLPAIETLGSTTVVCTDKTRTLTTGRMTVVRLWSAGKDFVLNQNSNAWRAESVRAALEVAALASRPQPGAADDGTPAGDPVDVALLSASEDAGVDRLQLIESRPQVGLIPFSSDRKFMASFHQLNSGLVAYVKGAPGRILDLSRTMLSSDVEEPMDDEARQRLRGLNEEFARSGLRVIGVARGTVTEASQTALTGLSFVGLIGLADPPAPGVKETIKRLRSAGLRTLMLTGDQRRTAESVGRELGLLSDSDSVIDARELDTFTPKHLEEQLAHAAAFSRITPQHKLTLVKALQGRGEIVAMLGDGVNDAPALRKADVGVAMGVRGTDVAKEAAAIVLQDDRFETIAAAVEEGRVIFDNIRKFVFYLFSCNLAEILVLLLAGLTGLPLPLLPLQILWLNMVTDTFPALALALEPAESDVMKRPPQDPQAALLSRSFLARVLFYGGLLAASTLAAYLLALDGPQERARTVAFMTLALAQILHLGNARSTEPVLHPRRALRNRFALGAVAVSIVLQLAAVYFEPIAIVLRVVPLSLSDWGFVVGLAAVPAVFGQALKIVQGRRSR